MLRCCLVAAGKPLHHEFAAKAASVDGEMVDLVGNMALVRAFSASSASTCASTGRSGSRIAARGRSLLYLEKLRIHARYYPRPGGLLLDWVISLWEKASARTATWSSCAPLASHPRRDARPCGALVDATQHIARLSEAIHTLLVPHDLSDHPEAVPLSRGRDRLRPRLLRLSRRKSGVR